ncbi:flavin-containing monooxygenase [Sphingomonas daechungensis]|uniref:flavin-containing monooxygenase n=1 Tax=Sphingomonas daechungensis TaxID=1176646 RepID=UPI0037835D6A
MARDDPQTDHIDVLIVGAGMSGIDAAYRIQTLCKDKTYVILEARDRIGGTWDLFRYPGVRSDSDMYTLGFPFRPWASEVSIARGEAIRNYVEDTAREFGIDRRIRFGHRVIGANWSSEDGHWTVEVEHDGATRRITCLFLFACSGYYDYSEGYRPVWEGEADFKGQIVHPQFWPEDLDVSRKTVAVIGSGATAVTLVPSLADQAAHVTMVQRSPPYIVARPARDRIAGALHRILPRQAAGSAIRWKNVLLTIFMYNRTRRKPEKAAEWIKGMIQRQLPADYPIEQHFSPPYKVWDQRLCLVPDGNLFTSIRSGKTSVATGAIERFTPTGLRLVTGEEVKADIVVTATGLVVKLFGGVQPERMIWKGMMLSGVPNYFLSFGYTNASWTLRSDVTAKAVCRLLNRMDDGGFTVCAPRIPDGGMERLPVISFSSGYVQRALPFLPKQGSRQPWIVPQNYVKDRFAMRLGPIDEDLEMTRNATAVRT